jgi:hypothetical protein
MLASLRSGPCLNSKDKEACLAFDSKETGKWMGPFSGFNISKSKKFGILKFEACYLFDF